MYVWMKMLMQNIGKCVKIYCEDRQKTNASALCSTLNFLWHQKAWWNLEIEFFREKSKYFYESCKYWIFISFLLLQKTIHSLNMFCKSQLHSMRLLFFFKWRLNIFNNWTRLHQPLLKVASSAHYLVNVKYRWRYRSKRVFMT